MNTTDHNSKFSRSSTTRTSKPNTDPQGTFVWSVQDAPCGPEIITVHGEDTGERAKGREENLPA